LVDAQRWRGTNGVSLLGSSSGLAVNATVQVYGGASTFGPADVPASLPAVVVGSQSGVAEGVGLDGATITLKPVASVDALPGGVSDATMVDLALAERLQSGPMLDTTEQVWLTAGAPHDTEQRLAAVGISVVSVQTATAKDVALSRGGISLAYVFFLLAAVAAALLALGSTVFALVVAARRRTDELVSLQAVGLDRASLRRSLVIEQGMVIVFGIILGLVAGIAATVAALASVPEFVASIAGPPLDYGLPLGALGVELLAVGLSLMVAVGVTARLVVDRASVDNVGRDQS
jgi:ABC-type antimicrobial peptide transport system permease subunit